MRLMFDLQCNPVVNDLSSMILYINLEFCIWKGDLSFTNITQCSHPESRCWIWLMPQAGVLCRDITSWYMVYDLMLVIASVSCKPKRFALCRQKYKFPPLLTCSYPARTTRSMSHRMIHISVAWIHSKSCCIRSHLSPHNSLRVTLHCCWMV